MRRQRRTTFWRGERGNSSAEFAMIASAFCLVFFGVVQFALVSWIQNGLHYATAKAARCWSVGASSCTSASATATYAATQAIGLNIPSSAFTASTPSCGHQVSASYKYQFLLAGMFPYAPTLTATACEP